MNNKSNKPCKFFIQGTCKFSEEECKFSHGEKKSTDKLPDSRVIAERIYYKPKSSRTHHKDEYESEHPRHKKNTESFVPNFTPADMRVLVENGKNKTSTSLLFQSKDVIVIPELFCEVDDMTIHNKLLEEMEKCGVDSERLWKLWHGDTHMIADDSTHFKEKCPTFLKILDKIRDYFGMDIKATRFNLYRDDQDFKPFHFDASAVKPDKAKIQNITVGVSFGRTREIAFEDALEGKGHRRVVSFPMPNGFTYAFCKDINVNWRHGVPAIVKENQKNESRISIIAWGWREQVDV